MNQIATFKDLEVYFGRIVEILIGLGGIIFFIMLIMGGFSYMSAGGDPKQIEGARKTLTFAIGGMVLLALSLLIFRVIEAFTGVNLLEFKVVQ
ncbi:hypothetical protein HY502_01585 [Candidatus Woesebacteria bacterium]|nr:hypothetical protein [Candidatus Woesebacteria bacterium]